MPFHLRYTPYELSANITDFCDKFDKYIVASESKSKLGQEVPLHYHCYIESHLNMDTIRKHLQKMLSIPSSGRGTNNKYYMLKAWNDDISYIVKQGNIIKKKGFDEEAIQNGIAKGKKEIKIQAVEAPASKKEIITEWNKILENAIVYWKSNNKKEISLDKWVKLIMYWSLKDLKPITHTANLKRYALSLDLLCRSDWGENDEYLQKQIDETPTLDSIFQKSP